MKKLLIVLFLLIGSQHSISAEYFYPDEIHGTLGLINNTADNYPGAMLILDDKTKTMSILLRATNRVGPLIIIDSAGIKRPNINAFKVQKITSTKFAVKGYRIGPLTNLNGTVRSRLEGGNTYNEIILFNNKSDFGSMWDDYVTGKRLVVEIQIDGYDRQLVFTRP